jgi:hypothetical protein
MAFRSFCLSRCSGNVRRGGCSDDPTQLIGTLQVTELVGAVSMLYGMLLHQGAPSRGSGSPPPALPSHTIAVTIATIRLLNRVAELDLQMFQVSLSRISRINLLYLLRYLTRKPYIKWRWYFFHTPTMQGCVLMTELKGSEISWCPQAYFPYRVTQGHLLLIAVTTVHSRRRDS